MARARLFRRDALRHGWTVEQCWFAFAALPGVALRRSAFPLSPSLGAPSGPTQLRNEAKAVPPIQLIWEKHATEKKCGLREAQGGSDKRSTH